MSSFPPPPPPIPITIPKVIDSLKLAFPYITHKGLKNVVAGILMTGHIDHESRFYLSGLHVWQMTGIHWQVSRLLKSVILRSEITDNGLLARYDNSELSGINTYVRQIPEWVEERKRRRQAPVVSQP